MVYCFNAARSIVCVETTLRLSSQITSTAFQCRTQHCVCRDHRRRYSWSYALCCFNAARSIVCVETHRSCEERLVRALFQCRTQHCVCRDSSRGKMFRRRTKGFNAARSIVCVETLVRFLISLLPKSFNAARSIVCVETLCPAALVPRGLRRHFGKTRFFAPFLASADELCPEKWGSHRRCPLCGAGCTVLERRNGGMRLCARAGALSISFSSYLMIAHASFFFNDVFASMQRGR